MSTERITIRRGETHRVIAAATNQDGEPESLTGWGIAATVRKGSPTGPVQHEFDFAGGTSAQVDTATWEPGNYYYDVRLTDPLTGDEDWSPITMLVVYDGPTEPTP